MRLKRALSQIKPTDGQRDKIYGDILEKLSEKSPEKKKETRIIMKKKTVFSTAAAAVLAVALAGGTAYAVSPDVQEAVNNLLGINRQATEEFYDIQSTEAGFEAIKNAVTVTENDFTEFAEGIRVKLVSAANLGTYAEIILEFELDEPFKSDYCLLNDVSISNSGELPNYTVSGLNTAENGKIYSVVTLRDIENIPKNSKYNFELKSLSFSNSDKVIEGYYGTDFAIDASVKSCALNIAPTEVFWATPFMGGETAHMEISGIEYSPKSITADLRMLEDCLVDCKFEYGSIHGESKYLNSTIMLSDRNMGGEFSPIKFRMSDGTLKDVSCLRVTSNAEPWRDDDDEPLYEDIFKASQNIPKDVSAKVTFELAGIMDYTDVEAIVFCGVEIPITEKNF